VKGAILCLDKYTIWYKNIKTNISSINFVNYWTKNWIPDKSRLNQGDIIVFRMNGLDVAEGSYMYSKKQTIERAYEEYKVSNGVSGENSSMEEFTKLIELTTGDIKTDSKLGCILIGDMKIYSEARIPEIPSKASSRIVYFKTE
jgi:hypothetical protein